MPEVPGSLAEALITLQASLPRIRKDDEAQVGTRVYSYAKLSTITDAVLPRLAELGLYWVCQPTMDGERFVLRYELRHRSGQSIDGDYPLPSGNPQTMGGAITYARRYALCAVLGLAPAEDDDDAAAATAEARDRQNQRTRAIANESVHSPPPHPRPAERLRGPLPDDEFTTPAVTEDTPGTSNNGQHQTIGMLLTRIGITDRPARLHAVTSRLKLDREISTSKDLSYREAANLILELRKEAG